MHCPDDDKGSTLLPSPPMVAPCCHPPPWWHLSLKVCHPPALALVLVLTPHLHDIDSIGSFSPAKGSMGGEHGRRHEGHGKGGMRGKGVMGECGLCAGQAQCRVP